MRLKPVHCINAGELFDPKTRFAKCHWRYGMIARVSGRVLSHCLLAE